MKKNYFITLLLLPTFLFAQNKHDYNWVSGRGDFQGHFGGIRLNFNAGEPELIHFPLPDLFGFHMPCSISNENGNLEFYTNGCRIINAANELIENGDEISPGFYHAYQCEQPFYGYDSYQNMMILPRPGHPRRYLYFHHTIEWGATTGSILYTEVDMNLNEGKGKVIEKNTVLRGPQAAENSFTAVRHGNGRDWWVIIPQEFVNIYNLYLLTPDSLLGPFTQDYEDSTAAEFEKYGWNIVFSPDGAKFARVTLSEGFNRIFLYDFDRCSGTLSNAEVITVADPDVYASWAAISPNSRYLYFQIAQSKLYQFDLWAADIASSQLLIGEYDGFTDPLGYSGAFHAMALAPNGKIYMCCTSGTYFYHTIHAPDEAGAACQFLQHDLQLPAVPGLLMPSYPNFRLFELPGSVCDSLGINTPTQETGLGKQVEIHLSPNPAVETVQLLFGTAPATYRLRVFDLQGRVMLQKEANADESVSFSVKDWPVGAYWVQVTDLLENNSWVKKLIVE